MKNTYLKPDNCEFEKTILFFIRIILYKLEHVDFSKMKSLHESLDEYSSQASELRESRNLCYCIKLSLVIIKSSIGRYSDCLATMSFSGGHRRDYANS